MGRPYVPICPKCLKRDKHKDRPYCYECTRAYHREADRRRRQEILDHFGGACLWCGFDDPRALQIDHVFDDGADHRRSLSSTGRSKNTAGKVQTMLRRMIRNGEDTSRFQLLCANCNWIKKDEAIDRGIRSIG